MTDVPLTSNGSVNLHVDEIISKLTHLFILVAAVGLLLLINIIITSATLALQDVLIEDEIEIFDDICETNSYTTTISTASGFPNMESLSWETIVQTAQTQTLNFYLWSPENSSPRRWIDEQLTPTLQSLYAINVNRISAVYSGCDTASLAVVCDVANEIDAGLTTSGGAVDLIWINGANFAAMKAAGTLYGAWATLVPNAINFDFTDPAIAFDKGTSIEGLEMPFNQAQSVFLYDEILVSNPPLNIPDLMTWIENNPGRFIYSDPTLDYTGAAFIRHVFYYYGGDNVGSWEDLLGEFDQDLFDARAPAVWAALNAIEPFLFQNNSGNGWYPSSHNEDIRPLIGDQTLWLDFSMQASEASTQIDAGLWADTMQAYVLETGTIADTNYLAIPINANNKEAALVTANYIASAGSMFVRSQPDVWGALQAFDPTTKTMLEWDPAFDYINLHEATPTVEALAEARLSDLNADWVNAINEGWAANVRDL